MRCSCVYGVHLIVYLNFSIRNHFRLGSAAAENHFGYILSKKIACSTNMATFSNNEKCQPATLVCSELFYPIRCAGTDHLAFIMGFYLDLASTK